MFHWRLENLGRLRVAKALAKALAQLIVPSFAEAGGGRRRLWISDARWHADASSFARISMAWRWCGPEIGVFFANGISACGVSSHAPISLRLCYHAARANGFYREDDSKAGCHAAQYTRVIDRKGMRACVPRLKCMQQWDGP